MRSNYPCAMEGCNVDSNSGLFKIDNNLNKAFIIPLCENHFHELVIMRNHSSKKILMVIDYKKLPLIDIIDDNLNTILQKIEKDK